MTPCPAPRGRGPRWPVEEQRAALLGRHRDDRPFLVHEAPNTTSSPSGGFAKRRPERVVALAERVSENRRTQTVPGAERRTTPSAGSRADRERRRDDPLAVRELERFCTGSP